MSKVKSSAKTTPKKSNIIDNIVIKVDEYEKIDDSYNNYLKLSISGTAINNVVLNTLRRTIIELVPTYAFDKKDIDITKNTSIYNNDYMRLRLCHFPIFGIDNNRDTIKRYSDLEYDANISMFEKKIEDLTILQQKEDAERAEKSQNFIMSVNMKNTTNDVLNVTTDDQFVKFYYKARLIESPYRQKLLIIKLKPGEEFRCTATSTLNIGLKSANFMPNAVCVFSEPEQNSDVYKFNIESLKQISEKEILIRGCLIVENKLNHFLEIITNKIIEYKSEKLSDGYNLTDSDSESITESAIRNTYDEVLEQHHIKGMINIENESHTFGNLLSRFLQDHPAILFAGYKIDHLLVKELTIGYKTDGSDIVTILNEIVEKATNVFKHIREALEKLNV